MSDIVTQVLSNLEVDGSIAVLRSYSDYPPNPKIGQFCLINNQAFIYMIVDGLETWYPFASKTNSFVHTQGIANTTWTVNHGLGTTNVWIQVRDSQDNIVYVSTVPVDENSFQLKFTSPLTGTVFVVAPDSINVPSVKAISVSVGNGAVLIDNSGVRINGVYALTNTSIDYKADQTSLDAHTGNLLNPHSTTKAQVGLGNVDNTSDVNKPLSIAAQTALALKLNTSALPSLVSAFQNDASYASVDDVSSMLSQSVASLASVARSGSYNDLSLKPTNVSHFNNDALYQTLSDVDTRIQNVIGTAPSTLDTLGELASKLASEDSAIAALVSTTATKVYTDTQLALKADTSALASVSLDGSFYSLVDRPTTTDVTEGLNLYYTDLRAATAAPVKSVAGKTGIVTLDKSDVGLSNVDNTTDLNKPVSTSTQTVLDTKVSKITGKQLSTEDYTTLEKTKLSNIEEGAQVNVVTSVSARTGAVTLSKSDVGLGNVDNTTDLSKPISTATQTALNLKATLASPTFTGTVSGVTKSMVGLTNVDDTTDLLKPISTATQTALDLKVDKVVGKQLSSEDYTLLEKNKVSLLSGSNTGDQTITLTGDVTGSGTGSFVATLSNTTVTAGSYGGVSGALKIVVDSKGRVLQASMFSYEAAMGYTPERQSNKNIANGYLGLNASTKIDSTYLPSYVDDVLEYETLSVFPATGETSKIYIDLATNKTYRWSGTVYVRITSGAVDSVAGKTGIVTLAKSDVGLSNVDNTTDLLKPISTATQDALDALDLAAQSYIPTVVSAFDNDLLYAYQATTQPLDADLSAIAALEGVSGILKKTAADTWALDTTSYLSANQFIMVTGDVSGSGSTNMTLTLANTAVTAASYGSATAVASFTVDSKGRLTAAGNTTITPAFSSITSKPTTLSGYGITDAVSSNVAMTAGSYNSVTVDAKGLVTEGSQNVIMTDGVISYHSIVTPNTAADQVVFSIVAQAIKVFVTLWYGSNARHVSELLMTHDGTTASITEYASIYTGTSLGSFTADILSGSLRLLVTPTTANTKIKAITTFIQ